MFIESLIGGLEHLTLVTEEEGKGGAIIYEAVRSSSVCLSVHSDIPPTPAQENSPFQGKGT